MKTTPLVILAALLVALLIALAPFITVIAILYGFTEFVKYYLPSKQAKKLQKIDLKKQSERPKQSSSVNDFIVQFLHQ